MYEDVVLSEVASSILVQFSIFRELLYKHPNMLVTVELNQHTRPPLWESLAIYSHFWRQDRWSLEIPRLYFALRLDIYL